MLEQHVYTTLVIQHPVMIAPCYNFLNRSPVTNESRCTSKIYLLRKKLFDSFLGLFMPPALYRLQGSMPRAISVAQTYKTTFRGYTLTPQKIDWPQAMYLRSLSTILSSLVFEIYTGVCTCWNSRRTLWWVFQHVISQHAKR